jgi:glyoxylase-like metal-dependent hydrolase (beta-lactamase superfamily II)
MATITAFEVGYCTHRACMAVKGAGLRVCRFPARVWLIEAGGQRWLWDTGYSHHFQRYTTGIFRLYRWVTPVYYDDTVALQPQLKSVGVLPSDLRGILISHFHGDHIAGLRDFPGVPLFCAEKGWAHVRTLKGFAAVRKGFVPELLPPDFAERVQFVDAFQKTALPSILAPFTEGYTLPGSQNEVILVDLPGHAAGQLGAFVETKNGWCLLASDAAWAPDNYRLLRGPSRLSHIVMHDTAAYYQTLQKLHQLSIPILLCHEGEI